MTTPYHIAVDLGAGSGRVIIGRFHNGALETREARRFEHGLIERGGLKRWDWDLIKKEVFAGLARAAALAGAGGVASVSCDRWAQDFGLLRGGELIYPPVSYRDSRTEGIPQKIYESIPPEIFRRRAGSALSPVTTLCQLKAMSLAEPETLARADTLLYIADLAHFELCGAAVSDWTMASASQMWNIKNNRWDTALLETLGIPSRFLPSVIKEPQVIGVISSGKTPHPDLAGVPVVSGAGHDTAAAAAALLPLDAGTLFLSLGTWGMLGCPAGSKFNPEKYPDCGDAAFLGLPYGKWGVFIGGAGLWPGLPHENEGGFSKS
jgi:sugar (pentulose or hexulose) kinase